MASKKRCRKRPGLVWRVLFGQHGPTKKALKKAVADMVGPKAIASISHDPATGKLVMKNLVVDKRTGQIAMAPKRARKQTAKKATSIRASKPSKPSRSGHAQRRTAAAPIVQQQPRQRAKSVTERTDERRRPDGKFNGSAPAIDPRVKTAQDYQRIMQQVERLNRLTDRDLGWDREV